MSRNWALLKERIASLVTHLRRLIDKALAHPVPISALALQEHFLL